MAIDTLLPKKLDKAEDSYKSVLELNEALLSAEKERIKNIALTGPYGSGKSSVLITLMEDFPKGRNYLPISLATLQANEEGNTTDDEAAISGDENRIENLNRKIEYSILQQLIYREDAKTVPNSRFRRIVHLSKWKLIGYSIYAVLSLVCFFILFEPDFAKVESIYNVFNFGDVWNMRCDFLAAGYLLVMLFFAIRYVLRSYSNSKLNKLNLKDAEIGVVENNSIFNKHLDEILYFFQVTKYNVVIIEDLDRFDTPNIFLKLRELNQLINESNIVGRHITFVYAVKDDIFKDEERTKFFDYIITVIPVINPSNSKDKLKAALELKGCGGEISDVDLSEMAFFIQDMRILTNIVNEYKQYRNKLCTTKGAQLNKTKLLAMIVYKNYYPQDFALLHRRQGKVYQCISSKRLFVDLALDVVRKQTEELAEKEKIFLNNLHLNVKELRLILLYKWRNTFDDKLFSINIDNHYYSLEDISNSDVLFESLRVMRTIEYRYYYYGSYNTNSRNVDIESFIKNNAFLERIEACKSSTISFEIEKKIIRNKTREIKSLRLNELIAEFDLGKTNVYINIHMSAMQDIFIRLGYLDEDYYDYISYFYPEMVSLNDRELLLCIKRQIEKPYETHIDKIENFVKELKEYMFKSDAILNIELLDYLAISEKHNEMFEHVMSRLERDMAPLRFLYQYYLEGKQNMKVFKHYIEYANAWNNILNWNNVAEKEYLIEAYLNFSIVLDDEVQEWLNNNFNFLVNHVDGLGLDKALNLAANSCFINISNGSDDLLDCVIEYNGYEINLNNLFVVTKHLCKGNIAITSENLNYTRICETQNSCLINYVQQNIAITLQKLKDCNKDESSDSILYILNSPDIDSNTKRDYLNKQFNRIGNFDQIVEASVYDIAIETKVIQPTWQNVLFFYRYKGNVSEILIDYINHYINELSKEKYPETLTHKEELFASIFGNNILSIENYKKLLPVFTDVYPSVDSLEELEEKRLLILIECGRLPFNQEALDVINETGVLAEYLIYHSNEFVAHLDLNYNFNVNNVLKILKEKTFTLDEKYHIIGILPSDVLQSSPLIADIVINVFCEKEKINIELETLIFLVKTCSSEKNKIQIVTLVAKKGNYEHNTISRLLNVIGDSYVEVADINKRAKLQNTDINRALLAALKNADFISNYTKEGENDEFLRIYHKRKSAIQ